MFVGEAALRAPCAAALCCGSRDAACHGTAAVLAAAGERSEALPGARRGVLHFVSPVRCAHLLPSAPARWR